MKMKIDKTKCKFGFVSKLYEGVGRTGYQMDMLFHNGKQTFDIARTPMITAMRECMAAPLLGRVLLHIRQVIS